MQTQNIEPSKKILSSLFQENQENNTNVHINEGITILITYKIK